MYHKRLCCEGIVTVSFSVHFSWKDNLMFSGLFKPAFAGRNDIN